MSQKLAASIGQSSSFLDSYKIPLIMSFAVILLGILAYGAYSYVESQNSLKALEKAYEFEEKTVKDYTDKKIKAEEALSALSVLLSSGRGESLLAVINLSDKMSANKEFKEAARALQMAYDVFKSKDSYLDWIVMEKLSVAHENADDFSTARSVLETMLALDIKIRVEKVYLDIGRLSMKLGDKEKAKASFEYIINELPPGDYTKIAGVYLDEMGL